MGFADRDYNRAASPGYSRGRPARGVFGTLPMWSVTTWIIAINVAVFIVDGMLGGRLTGIGEFSKITAINDLQLWRFVTFQFLHVSISHIFFNMLALYFFGPMIEEYLGARRYLVFYLLCGVAGAVMYLLMWAVGFFDGPAGHQMGANTPLVGASAGIFGVLIAAASVAPNTTIVLLFPPIPMKLRTLAWIMLGIAVYTVWTNRGNAGGEAAHLGGAALGALLIRNPQWLNFANTHRKRPRRGFFMDK